jgi:undecaprenyl diphosphate synthase
LRVAVDYSSRDAIARAALRAVHGLNGTSTAESVGRAMESTLREQGGDVDLLIRTGGEKRLSDFLLWESAYAELVFTDRMWPDFDGEDLEAAVGEFRRRERRFGGTCRPGERASRLEALASEAGTRSELDCGDRTTETVVIGGGQ